MIVMFKIAKTSKKKMFMTESGVLSADPSKAATFSSKNAAMRFAGLEKPGSFEFESAV